MRRSTVAQTVYLLIRHAPVMAFLLFGTFPQWTSIEEISAPFSALLLLIAALIVWGMAEGTVLLWHKARITGTVDGFQQARGYLIVSILLALLLLPLIVLFRYRVTPPLFVALLVALSFRGLSKTAWDQHKGYLATGTAFLSAFVLAALSFAIFRQTKANPVTWQALLISASLASSLLAVELVWHSKASSTLGTRQTPLFRVALFLGPVLVGTLAFIGQLPLCYSSVYLLIPVCQKAVVAPSRLGHLTECDQKYTLIAAGAFLLLLIACRSYENGWLL